MSLTNEIVKDRAEIAQAIRDCGFILRHEADLDTDFPPNASKKFQSQYIEFKIPSDSELGFVWHTIRIADHMPSKPGMSECMFDTAKNITVSEIIAALGKIAANTNEAANVYEAYNDVADLSEWALKA